MAVVSIKNKLRRGNLLVGNTAYDPAAFESIASATGTGSAGTITFSSIPGTYQHLQIRYNAKASVNGNGILLQFNSSTSSIYTYHLLYGNGSTVTADGAADSSFNFAPTINGTNTTYTNVAIIDIHDYASTTKNKTIRMFGGIDKNGSGEVSLFSGLYRNTSAITSINIYMSSGNWTTDSTFALYGIAGA